MLLGFVFVLIVVFMPDGLVPGLRRWCDAMAKSVTPALADQRT